VIIVISVLLLSVLYSVLNCEFLNSTLCTSGVDNVSIIGRNRRRK